MAGRILSLLCALQQLLTQCAAMTLYELPASSYASALAPAATSDELSNLQLLVPRLSAPPSVSSRSRDALLSLEHLLKSLDTEPLASLADGVVAKLGELLPETSSLGDRDAPRIVLDSPDTSFRGNRDTPRLPFGNLLLPESTSRGDRDTLLLPLGNLILPETARGDSDTSSFSHGSLLPSKPRSQGNWDASRLPFGNLLLPETDSPGGMVIPRIPPGNLLLPGLEDGKSDEVVEDAMSELCRFLRGTVQHNAALVHLTQALCNMYMEERDANATVVEGADGEARDSAPHECPVAALALAMHAHDAAACPACLLLQHAREEHSDTTTSAPPPDTWSLQWFGPPTGRRQWVDEPDQFQEMIAQLRKEKARRLPPNERWRLTERKPSLG